MATNHQAELRWAIVVDGDCEPVTGMAHLMIADPWPLDEIESRRPVCGQSFREGWMQIAITDTQTKHCKKCARWMARDILRLLKWN